VTTPPSSNTSESESESTCTTPSFEPQDLISDSYEASEDSDDQEGRGTVAIAVALITVRGLTAMPNVREKDVSISARNHEPDSFSQFHDNHERRPLAEVVPHPKLSVMAMELLANAGAYVDVILKALLEEMGEGGFVSHLVDQRATVRLAPAGRQPVEMTKKPSTALVVTEKSMTLGAPSTTLVSTEKQKALAKLSALVPLTSGTVLSAPAQLIQAEWL
jgi:hypothetical protein